MLSISTKRGTTSKDVGAVAKYPDESKDKAKAPGAIEDYYSQGNDKTPSVWMGSAAEALGLKGAVDRDDHIKTLMGQDPRSGQGLVHGSGEDRKYCVDLTFSAPKSVSLVWAIGSEETRAGVEAAQTRAVQKVLEHIEQNFPLARQGSSSKGTIEHVKAKLLAAAFLHGSSRPVDGQSIPDPQVHTHLMLQNMALRPDGTWGALDHKQLFEWKMALGAVYRAELAKEVQVMGFQVEADGNYFRIVGISKGLEKETSQRREQILEALAKLGLQGGGGKASEIANLANRFEKGDIPGEILQAGWNARAEAHGVTRETIETLKGLEKEPVKEIDRAEILQKLTQMEAVFQEKDLFKEAAIALSHKGRGLEEVKQEVAALKRHPDIVMLRGQDGKQYFTTKEMLELEKGILSRARAGQEDRSHILHEKTVREAISRFEKEKGFSLADEQKAAIDHMTQTPGQIKIVQGHAGAGKSTALTPVKYALEAEGREVIGAALQGKTAKGLEESTGIKSQTIASLLRDLEGYDREDGTRADHTRKLSSKSVVIIDEAAMVDTRTMARIQALTHAAGAELLLVGDDRQVPPVAAGSPYRSMKAELGYAELTENRRQKADWQKEASREIRAGQIKEGLQKYLDADMITIAKDRDGAMTETVARWAQDFDPKKPGASLLTAFRKVDVGELNARAREAMKEKGLLEGIRCEVQTSTGIKEFQAGDRIFFSRNSKTLGVMNGETGTLLEIKQNEAGDWLFHVRMDSAKELAFDPLRYEHIQHGYATTINKSQGATVESTYNLAGGGVGTKLCSDDPPHCLSPSGPDRRPDQPVG
ncbi:MAG: MobF family relaxase [Nitrospirota bacterium]|nr:MobF family relaxase [Nitrospirota bacterium]